MMQLVQNNVEEEHIVTMPTTKKMEIDSEYNFLPDSVIFKTLSKMLYILICPFLYIYSRIINGLEINGIENLKNIKGGKITISNHIHYIDCVFASFTNFPNPIYFPTIQSNFEIPIIRVIIKLLNAVPIPKNMNAKKEFVNAINKLLKEEKTVHLYPEGSLWPYYKKIRKFKTGAFVFACKNNVPIIPMVYTYRNPTKIMQYIKTKPYVTLNILKPIYPEGSSREDAVALKNKAEEIMKKFKNDR
ncbi:MAG: lysophospholipid acyltransferase family protein [Clostridia bacterium]